MEQGHKEALQVEFPAIAQRVFLLSEIVGAIGDIPDPSGGSDAPSRVREMAETLQKMIVKGGAHR